MLHVRKALHRPVRIFDLAVERTNFHGELHSNFSDLERAGDNPKDFDMGHGASLI
jgi:hypothetical protein